MDAESKTGNCDVWTATGPDGVLSPHKINRRAVRSDDVSLRISHRGVCYADVIWTQNKHGDSIYSLVPGTVFSSHKFLQNFFKPSKFHKNHTIRMGPMEGYSSHTVVCERFCFKIPDGYPLVKAGPLLCAGILVYTPMIWHNMNQAGKSLDVIGLGGLGHMAVKFGKALGLKVTVSCTKALKGSLHFIIDTAAGNHPFDPYLSLLKAGGTMTLVGFPCEINMHPGSLIFGARTLSGSGGGGTKGIQEMLNFCAANRIYPEVEVIKMDYINEALKRLVNRDVKYRFVIDRELSELVVSC